MFFSYVNCLSLIRTKIYITSLDKYTIANLYRIKSIVPSYDTPSILSFKLPEYTSQSNNKSHTPFDVYMHVEEIALHADTIKNDVPTRGTQTQKRFKILSSDWIPTYKDNWQLHKGPWQKTENYNLKQVYSTRITHPLSIKTNWKFDAEFSLYREEYFNEDDNTTKFNLLFRIQRSLLHTMMYKNIVNK
jgi:hypothetical protein